MAYAVDESNLERQELLADVFEDVSRRLLDHLDTPSGAACLDAGCGIGRTTELLVDRLPDPERVVGLDADPDLLEVARDRRPSSDAAEFGYRTGDATELPFPDDSFDLVFARFLLAHLPEPEAAVLEFARVCRPGGTIAVQEPDFASTGAWPPNRAYERAAELAGALFDVEAGRKAWKQLVDTGIRGTEVDAEVIVETEGDTVRRLVTRSLEAIGGGLLEEGVLAEEEYEELVAEARGVEDEDRHRLVAIYTVYSVWGRWNRPGWTPPR